MIRDERAGDAAGIRALLLLAFPTPFEAELVDALRASGCAHLSLVDDEGGDVIGQILFTPVTLDGPDGLVTGYGLAPMAVRPDRQRRGVGSALVRAGLARVHAAGVPFVFLIGHPEFYPRFGFGPASRDGLRPQWDGISDDAVMSVVFDRAAVPAGVVRFRPAFG